MAQRTIKPKTRFSSPLFTGEDAVALGAKYAIPIAELVNSSISAAKKRKNLPTRFMNVDLQGVPVKDMVRPSFAPRYRPNMGSSLAERMGSQKMGDAFQTAQENQFEMQNEQMKRNQEYQNAQIENQESIFNAEQQARGEYLNKNMLFSDYMRDRINRDAALDYINIGLADDPRQIFSSKKLKDQDKARFMLTNPEQFEGIEGALDWARKTISPFRKGGKTKFSYATK